MRILGRKRRLKLGGHRCLAQARKVIIIIQKGKLGVGRWKHLTLEAGKGELLWRHTDDRAIFLM